MPPRTRRRVFFCLLSFARRLEDGEEGVEGEKRRGGGARGSGVADSIRHAGLRCKLLHGHRRGFYGRNTEAFLNSAAPATPAPHWRQKARGRGSGSREEISRCDLGRRCRETCRPHTPTPSVTRKLTEGVCVRQRPMIAALRRLWTNNRK